MKLSVITPTHNGKHLERLQESLKNQTYKNFEWVILCNNGFSIRRQDLSLDLTIRIRHFGKSQSIGEIKKAAFEAGQGEILVEVDHDDELVHTCLEELVKAFEDETVDFVYSNALRTPMSAEQIKAWQGSGWEFQPQVTKYGAAVPIAFEPSAHTVSKIWWAPDHVRAWRASFYNKIGGHDASLDVCDDHDLLCRTYIHGRMKHINKCLYIYHIHGENTCYGDQNAKIQQTTLWIHDKYIYQLALRECQLRGLKAIDLCGGHNCPDGFEPADLSTGIDLEKTWPWKDGEVGLFRAHDALEHMRQPIHVMSEAHRCLAEGGWFLTFTPSTDGRGAFQDPTHVSFWNSNSFWYYTTPEVAKYINWDKPFVLDRVYNYYPTDWHKQHEIVYVKADLYKPTARSGGVNPWRK